MGDENVSSFTAKPSYFTAVDRNQYTRISDLLEEMADWFSKAQLDQWNMWQANRAARLEESKARRENARLGIMGKPDKQFDFNTDGYSIAKLFNKRDSLLAEVTESRKLCRLVGEHVDVLMPSLLSMLSKRLDAVRGIVEQSVMAILSGLKMDYPGLADLRRLFWILSANSLTLKSGGVVSLFTKPTSLEWAPALITGHKPDATTQESGFLEFLLLGGTGATFSFWRKVPFTKLGIGYLNNQMFGLRRMRIPVQMPDTGYVGMHTWLLLNPDKGSRMFDLSACCANFKSLNRHVYDGRRQRCPVEQSSDCFTCTFGLDKCDKATHKSTYAIGKCDVCGNEQAWLPSYLDSVCVFCLQKDVK